MNTTNNKKTTEMWRVMPAQSLEQLKRKLRMKHGNFTQAAQKLNVPYIRLVSVLAGREQVFNVLEKIQADQELTDAQVLKLWPLLRQWPKKTG